MLKLCLRLILIVSIQLAAFNSASAVNFWTKTNGPYGASVLDIAIDKDNGEIYLATKSDGIYKSVNQGDNWISLNGNDLGSNDWVNDIEFGANGIMFAATDSLGILRKLPAQDWSAINSGMSGHLRFNAISRTSDGILIAGSEGKAVFKSNNNGDSWNLINQGLSSQENINCIIEARNGNIIIGTDNGIFVSDDDGDSWDSKGADIEEVYCLEKSIDGSMIIAGTEEGVYGSVNDGESWSPQNSGFLETQTIIALGVSDSVFYSVTDSGEIYKSTKTGFTWSPFFEGKGEYFVQSIALSQTGALYIGTIDAFYIWQNDEWVKKTNGLGLRTINAIAAVDNRGDVFAATDLGIYKTANNGDFWERLNEGLENNLDISAIITGPRGLVVAGTQGDGIFVSTNEGENWKKMDSPDVLASYINTLDTNSQGDIFAGTKDFGIYRTLDSSGDNWGHMYGDGIDTNEVISLAVSKDDYLFAGTRYNGLYRKIPSSTNWRKLDLGSTVNSIAALAYNEIEGGILYAAANDGLRRTRDNGSSWYDANGLSPNNLLGQVLSLAVGDNGHVFAGTTVKGVYLSSNNGDAWERIEDPINRYIVQALELSGRGFIFAGTRTGGCYRSIESTHGRVLQLSIEPKDTVERSQGESIDFTIQVTDLHDSTVAGAAIRIQNEIDHQQIEVESDSTGTATYKYDIPAQTPNGYYSFTFLGSKTDYLESDLETVVVDVKKNKISLEITPENILVKDWNQQVDYNITAKNESDIALENIKIEIQNEILSKTDSVFTDTNGEALYSFTIPDQQTQKVYELKFIGLDNSMIYIPSDTATREIRVDHNPVKIYGESSVCESEVYEYYTESDPDKSFKWQNISNGEFVGATDRDTVQVKWGSSGEGSFELQQTIISTDVKTSRDFTVFINAKPEVEAPEFTNPVCENEPLILEGRGENPSGGFFEGPGVNEGVFYGDSAGGEGTYKIYYTYENQYGCSATDSTEIEVLAVPSVSLNLDSAEVCESYFPFELTGGEPEGGSYSGPGVENDKLDPQIPGVGSHTITYEYADPSTGCVNTASQVILIKEAPQAEFILPDVQICLSETAYDLRSGVVEPTEGTFSGDGVDSDNEIFNAEVAGLGNHVLAFTTDTTIDGCPGIAAFEVEVIDVPQAPTITISPDSSYIESSAAENNRWYLNGELMQNETGQRIYPQQAGQYYAVIYDEATGCESFPSNVINYGFKEIQAELSLPKFIETFAPGETVQIPINLISNADAISILDSLTGELKFNGSVLFPVGETPKGYVDVENRQRVIPLQIEVDGSEDDGESLTTLSFVALLGDSSGSDIIFENVKSWKNGAEIPNQIDVEIGRVEIEICRAGEADQLIQAWGEGVSLHSLTPNPARDKCEVELSVTESGKTRLYVTDINGRKIREILNERIKPGKHKFDIDLSEFYPGAYLIILRTPTQVRAEQFNVIK